MENDTAAAENFEARLWAKEFIKQVRKDPATATDEDAVTAWFGAVWSCRKINTNSPSTLDSHGTERWPKHERDVKAGGA